MLGKSDPAFLDRILRVMRYCDSLATWNKEKLLFTVLDPSTSAIKVDGLRVIQIPEMVWTPWEIIVGRVFPVVLERSPFTLSIHEDGFPLDANLWQPNFLDYDYCSAPWERNGLVGTGGCALTSSGFNTATAGLPWYDGKRYGDEWVCIEQRQRLIEMGMKFAPAEVAIKYCTETMGNGEPSFAFHGRTHSPEKYRIGWEKIETWEKTL